MHTTAIIPARGGSKGLRDKNMKRLKGHTLVAHAVRKCLAVCDEVIVSSDSELILKEAAANGAMPCNRPAILARDTSPSIDVLRYVVAKRGITGRLAFIQCTAPLMTEQDVAACCERTDVDLAIACHPFHNFILTEEGVCVNRCLIPVPRRQDLTPQWVISGSVWACDLEYLDRDWYSGTIGIVPSEHPIRLDIDSVEDLRQAEQLMGDVPAMPMPDLTFEHVR